MGSPFNKVTQLCCPIRARKYKWRNPTHWKLFLSHVEPTGLSYRSPIITSYASSAFFIPEDSLSARAAACVHRRTPTYVCVWGSVYLCAHLCNCLFVPHLPKHLPSRGAIVFRLQVILKVASPWRKREASWVWLLSSTARHFPSLKLLTAGARTRITFFRGATLLWSCAI